MTQVSVTREKIDVLVRFLPLFSVPGREFIKKLGGGQPTQDGQAITMPFPIYDDDVAEFFHLAGQPCWSNYGYDPKQAQEMIGNDRLIARATLEHIKTMLTYCVRGERFSDGHWYAMLKSGRITAILQRLAVLRESLNEEK